MKLGQQTIQLLFEVLQIAKGDTMSEQETVAAVWKYVAYTEGFVITVLAGVIVKIAHWWVKVERPRVAADYQNLNKMVLKALDRNSDYLRDWYNKLHPGKSSRTQFDFDSSGKVSTPKDD